MQSSHWGGGPGLAQPQARRQGTATRGAVGQACEAGGGGFAHCLGGCRRAGSGGRGAAARGADSRPAPRLRAPAPRCSRRARSLVFPPRSRAPRSSGWPGGGAPRQARPAASPGVGGGIGRGLGTELLQPWLGTWGGGRGRCGGSEVALGPGAGAVNGARCRGRPGEGTRC